ncbi:hypothetical protein BT69DRAFT_1322435, partial [Atractiella rhizophila]
MASYRSVHTNELENEEYRLQGPRPDIVRNASDSTLLGRPNESSYFQSAWNSKETGSTAFHVVDADSRPRRRFIDHFLSGTFLISSFWLVASLAMALAHHFVYNSVDTRAIDDVGLSQNWLLRIGTGLGFAFQVFVTEAVSIAFTKTAWNHARTTYRSLKDISASFALNNSIFSYLHFALWRNSKSLVLISTIARLLAIPAILTPATLTASFRTSTSTMPCTVPTFSMANTLFPEETELVNYIVWKGDPADATYDGPSLPMQALATRVFLSSAPVTGWKAACESVNCTFTTTLQAPAYKCEDAPDDISIDPGTDFIYWNATD